MTYDAAFYEEEGRVARQSAAIVLPWLAERCPEIESAIDLGCGTGEWVKAAQDLGWNAVGVDRDVPLNLMVTTLYVASDLQWGYTCEGFDLAICLEVAEHLPEESAAPLVAGLAEAGAVLFSAATPGQPGIGHVNCQPHDYWHDRFAVYDLHPTFVGDQFAEPVADFYRRNLFLYR